LPALFAYLIAVCLLLGGGYGALSWLAAPEPVKVEVKVKPRPPKHDEAGVEANSPAGPVASTADAASSSAGDSDQAAAVSNGQGPSGQSGPGTGAMGAQVSEPAGDQQNRSAEASPTDAKQEVRRTGQAASPISPSNQQTTVATAPARNPVKRPHLRQAVSHSEKPAEKRGLAVMTLRTIEFADGRRVTRLIPYRSPERALAFDPDE
jgi:hypothetical protein